MIQDYFQNLWAEITSINLIVYVVFAILMVGLFLEERKNGRSS